MSEFVTAKVEIEETAATIGARRDFLSEAVEAIKTTRKEIERQIRRDRFFLTTLEPYAPDDDVSRVVRRMCDASDAAGVGPMATVAGVVAQEALEAMMRAGCTHGWVDNGGDVALVLEEPATMEVLCEPGCDRAFALELEPTSDAMGICTSSGRLGHSISFGNADVAVAIADSAVLADALATAIGNCVKDERSVGTCFEPFRSTKGFRGGLAICGGVVGMHGRLPKLVEVEHSQERMTVHSKMASSRYIGSYAEGVVVGA